MRTDIPSFWSLIWQSARILIILACFASAQAGSLQEAIIKDGCARYSDPKTIEPLKKFVEPAIKKGCVACHLDCNQLSPTDLKDPPDDYLKAKEPALCMECHASLGKDLTRAHDNQPLENSNCSSCHDPHSSDIPKLIRQYSHGPFATRSCSDCHPAPEEGKVGLLAGNVDSLCYKCHSDFKAEIAGKKSQHKLLSQSDRSCVECHDPHAANREYVLKKPVRDLCVSCHVEQQKQKSKKVSLGELPYLKLSSKHVHEPTKKSCLICHDAHASEFPRELRVSEKDLCMECHGPNSETIVQSDQPFPLFNGLVSLPPKTFEKLPRFELKDEYVHEPVKVSCALCHDAHASDYPMKLYAPVQDVCLTCHGLNAVRLYKTEQPTPLFGGRVILPPKPFQNLKILNLVTGMAGHPTAGHPIFVAAKGDRAELNCVTCHDSHSASTSPELLVGDKMAMCAKCHEGYGG